MFGLTTGPGSARFNEAATVLMEPPVCLMRALYSYPGI